MLASRDEQVVEGELSDQDEEVSFSFFFKAISTLN